MNIIKSGTFIDKGGFFPLALKHKDKVFVFCRTGAGHLGKDGKITTLVSVDGINWEIRSCVGKDGSDIRNPSAFIFPDGKILLAAYRYDVYDKNGLSAPAEHKAPHFHDTLIYTSGDEGFTWTELHADFSRVTAKIGKVSPHGAMFMYNNQLLMPAYCREGAFLLGTKDKGLSWEVYTQIGEAGMQEPYVIETPDNDLLAIMRTSDKNREKASVISRFTGKEWTEPELITGSMQHPANFLQLLDGSIILSYSDRNYDNQRILQKLSKDGGRTWGNEWQLGESFNDCDFGYPSTVEIEPEKLLTVFYVNKIENPYFFFGNRDFYTTEHVKGYYYIYKIK